MLDEPTINFVLGRVLRRRRRAWEENGALQVQPLGALRSRKRPDILIAEAGRDPVVIETEVAPANTVESDARARLDERTSAGDVVCAAFAVRLPESWRRARNEAALEAAIESGESEWAIWSLGEDGNPRRWPGEGWIRSGISLLAFAAYQSTLAHRRVRAASNALYEAVSAAGKKLAHLRNAGYDRALREIAGILLQRPNEQTFGMAALILANALAFHELLAGRGNLAHVPTLAELKWRDSGVLRKDDVVDAWSRILAVNYMPIFAVARDILIRIPDPFAQEIVTDLDEAVARAGLRALLPTHDVLSETFQRMIADRKRLASFYTLPETAALLAGLALASERAPGDRDWSDAEGLKSVAVADYACGTGTLLSAAYRRLAWLHESAGGDPASLHSAWMENSLIGIDVLPAAAHLTATILSGLYPLTHYAGSQIYIAPYGAGAGPDVSLGSLDLLEPQVDLADFVNLAAQVGARESVQAVLKTRAKQVDLCIMNPPYTRNTNHEGGRAVDPLPAFAAFGISADTQRQMARKLKRISRGTFAHGNAGMASYFLALADRATKRGGTVAMVLPLTFLTGSSWSDARAALAERYSEIIVVTISGLRDKASGFSADTDMAECLLIARKSPRIGPARAVMVSLDRRPADALSATLLAERIAAVAKSGSVPRLEDAPNGGAEIRIGNDRLGTLISIPLDRGAAWAGARVADYSLAQAAYHLAARGLAWLPGIIEQGHAAPIPIVPLDEIASLGPLHRDINGREEDREGRPRGPFDVLPLVPGEEPAFPVLWEHDASREAVLEFEPDCKAAPRPDADERKLAEVIASMTHLHINLDWQFNSQPLQAQWTPRPAIGGRAWPSVCLHPHEEGAPCDPEKERLQSIALLLWFNSTPGILIRWFCSNRQQHGRGAMTRETLAVMPVLDVRRLSEGQLSQCEDLFRRLRDRQFLPIHRLPEDRARADLDAGLLGGILGWPRAWFEAYGPLDLARRKLAAEPSVHGHKAR